MDEAKYSRLPRVAASVGLLPLVFSTSNSFGEMMFTASADCPRMVLFALPPLPMKIRRSLLREFGREVPAPLRGAEIFGGGGPGVALGGPRFTPGYIPSALRAGRRAARRELTLRRRACGVMGGGERSPTSGESDASRFTRVGEGGARGGSNGQRAKVTKGQIGRREVAPRWGASVWRDEPRVALEDSLHPRLGSFSPLGWKAGSGADQQLKLPATGVGPPGEYNRREHRPEGRCHRVRRRVVNLARADCLIFELASWRRGWPGWASRIGRGRRVGLCLLPPTTQTGMKEGDLFGGGDWVCALPGVALGGPRFTPGSIPSALRAGRRGKSSHLKISIGKLEKRAGDGRELTLRRRAVAIG